MAARRWVTVEGNVGAGKSTALAWLSEEAGVPVRQEPVDRWRPLLERVYSAPAYLSKDATAGRLMALQALVTLDAGRAPLHDVRLVERDPRFQGPVFVRAALRDGVFTEHEVGVLAELHARVTEWTPAAVIYLRCDPLVCQHRVRARARPEERALAVDHIHLLHRLYDTAFEHTRGPKFRVDVGQLSPEAVGRRVLEILESLDGPPTHADYLGPP